MPQQYLSSVSGFPAGLATGAFTILPQITSGTGAPVGDGSATVGTVYETSTPGTYLCLITYPTVDVTLPVLPWVHWSVSGAAIDDPFPIPMFLDNVNVSANNDKTGYGLKQNGLDLVLIEPTVNLPQAISLIGAATAGVSTINGNTITYAALNVAGTIRITATDINGVRNPVVLTLPPI